MILNELKLMSMKYISINFVFILIITFNILLNPVTADNDTFTFDNVDGDIIVDEMSLQLDENTTEFKDMSCDKENVYISRVKDGYFQLLKTTNTLFYEEPQSLGQDSNDVLNIDTGGNDVGYSLISSDESHIYLLYITETSPILSIHNKDLEKIDETNIENFDNSTEVSNNQRLTSTSGVIAIITNSEEVSFFELNNQNINLKYRRNFKNNIRAITSSMDLMTNSFIILTEDDIIYNIGISGTGSITEDSIENNQIPQDDATLKLFISSYSDFSRSVVISDKNKISEIPLEFGIEDGGKFSVTKSLRTRTFSPSSGNIFYDVQLSKMGIIAVESDENNEQSKEIKILRADGQDSDLKESDTINEGFSESELGRSITCEFNPEIYLFHDEGNNNINRNRLLTSFSDRFVDVNIDGNVQDLLFEVKDNVFTYTNETNEISKVSDNPVDRRFSQENSLTFSDLKDYSHNLRYSIDETSETFYIIGSNDENSKYKVCGFTTTLTKLGCYSSETGFIDITSFNNFVAVFQDNSNVQFFEYDTNKRRLSSIESLYVGDNLGNLIGISNTGNYHNSLRFYVITENKLVSFKIQASNQIVKDGTDDIDTSNSEVEETVNNVLSNFDEDVYVNSINDYIYIVGIDKSKSDINTIAVKVEPRSDESTAGLLKALEGNIEKDSGDFSDIIGISNNEQGLYYFVEASDDNNDVFQIIYVLSKYSGDDYELRIAYSESDSPLDSSKSFTLGINRYLPASVYH